MLVDILNSHPDCFCGHEIFSPAFVATSHIPWHLEGLPSEAELSALRLSDPVGLIELLDRLTRERGRSVVGFKLMYFEAQEFPAVKEYMMRNRDIRIIHVHRRDALRRFVSLRRAQRTGEWLVRGHNMRKQPAIRLSLRDILDDFHYNRTQEQSYATLDETHAVLHLTYEDMIVDMPGTVDKLWSFLGLRRWDEWNVRTVKTGTDSLRDSIANYDELKKQLEELAALFEQETV